MNVRVLTLCDTKIDIENCDDILRASISMYIVMYGFKTSLTGIAHFRLIIITKLAMSVRWA